jgi:DNA-binding NarL/FixJ family response regulator
MKKMRVVLADDHAMMREGMKALVDAQPDLEVIGEAPNGRIAVTLACELKPDVVVMDVSMPELNGLKASEQIKELCPDVKVLTLTRHAEESYVRQILKIGASGYLLKRSAFSELVRAIRIVASGKTYIDPEVTQHVVEASIRRPDQRGSGGRKELSVREQDVLRQTAWGYPNKEIAGRLSISVKTVEVHKANAMRKTGMNSRIDVVRYALRQGWLQDS